MDAPRKIHTSSVNLKFEDFGVNCARRSTRAGSLFTEEGEVISYKLERPRAGAHHWSPISLDPHLIGPPPH